MQRIDKTVAKLGIHKKDIKVRRRRNQKIKN